jgi:hypothetical protein
VVLGMVALGMVALAAMAAMAGAADMAVEATANHPTISGRLTCTTIGNAASTCDVARPRTEARR